MTLFMGGDLSAAEIRDRVADFLPILRGFAELLFAFGGEGVVLPRRTGFGFFPLVIHQTLATHFAEQRVKRAFLRREFGLAELFQNIRHVDLVRGHDLQHEELQEPFTDSGEFFVYAHENGKVGKWQQATFEEKGTMA